MVTAVIGAGPAGLLFTLAARVLADRAACAERWTILLFDKRTSYGRTHRLRMDPQPYREMGRVLQHEGYDGLLAFLEEHAFKPAVNELEERLSELVRDAGVQKQQLCIGEGPDDTTLEQLRERLEGEGRLRPSDLLTVVAADSVHSPTRELVRGKARPTQKVHQLVARLKLDGAGLPDELPLVEQLRLSKLLRSVMDYRRNPAGHAEVDLFVGAEEHRSIERLGANPKTPVRITPDVLRRLRAPLFEKIAEYLRDDFVPGGCEVTLWSSFVLEHKHMAQVAFELPRHHMRVFLVGDAAISLPFFRGMACLARCVLALAATHAELAAKQGFGEEDERRLARTYQEQVARIRKREVAIVDARARLIRGTCEFIRISALLPFPVQSWFLSLPDDVVPQWRLTPGLVLNGVNALLSAACALSAPLVAPIVGGDLEDRLLVGVWLYGACALLQIVGGVLYRHTVNLDAGSALAVKRLWTTQMLGLMAGGVAISLSSGWRDIGLQVVPGLSWFPFALCFVAGMIVYESLQRRWWARAEL